MSIPVTNGSGQSSVAAEALAGLQYQQIKVLGGEAGSTSVWGINPDRSAQVSVVGTINANVSGSVFATLSGAGSIIAVPTGNQSVSGTVGASVIGAVPIQLSNSSIITVGQGSIATVIIGGSIAASFTPPANQSVSGTVGASIIGYPSINIAGSIAGTYLEPAVVVSVTGVAMMFKTNINTSTMGAISANNPLPVTFSATSNQSVSGAVNVSGSVLLGSSNASVITVWQNSSVIAINAGSVVTIVPGSVITVWKDSSVLAVPVGSTIALLQSPSIVGTYAEDAASASGDKGLFTLNVRNDTMSSITSADGDYTPLATGPVGEALTANAPITKWVQGTADFRNGNAGASIIAIASGGSSVFTFITAVQIANMGSASVLVTFASGGSTLGYSIAPAGGGSNIYYPNALKTPGNFGFAASISGTASVLVSAQGFIAKI